VILRPQPGGDATVARARAAGIDALAIPLFEVVPVEWIAPTAADYDALLLTSANAVRHGGQQLAALRELAAYCVGEATAAAAQAAGLTVAGIGAGDAAALIEGMPQGLRLLHLAGRNHRALPGVDTIIVYDSAAIDPPPALDALIGGVAMVHSPRAGARLAELVEQRSDIAIAAISPAAAAACGGGWREVQAIAEPVDSALLALAAALCQTH
jgi:uroporphyrinogen-III synthase